MSSTSNRASHHQPTTSTEAAQERITSPILGISPQASKQEHLGTDYRHRKLRKQVKTKVSNKETAEHLSEASISQRPRDNFHKVNLRSTREKSQFRTEREHHTKKPHGGTEDYAMALNTEISPFGLERNHYELKSLSGTEQVNICISQQQHQSVQSVQHHPAKRSYTMILPVLKITSSTNPCGQDIL